MKQIYTLLLLLLVAGISACDKDQNTLNKLEGTWQIKQVTHLKQDTTKLPTSGTLILTKCDLDGDAKSCPGTFIFNSQPSKQLVYSVMDKGKTMSFTSVGSHVGFTYMIYGLFKMVHRSDNRLELEGEAGLSVFNASTPTPKRVDVRIVLER